MDNNGMLLVPEPTGHEIALASLERKFQLLRDLTTAVAKGFKTGLFLYGTGGCGKSYGVLSHLTHLDVPHKLFNSGMTAKGLFLMLQEAPDMIHVLEDVERLTKDPDAQGVLRSALWAQPGHDRVITWTTAMEGSVRVTFRGGLILISNRPMADLPELRALATRIEVHRLEVTDIELQALMRKLAEQGYRQGAKVVMTAEACLEVTEYLIAECRAAGCPLDLRLQQKSFQTYLQWESDWSTCHWKDLVAASVRQATQHFRQEANVVSREERRKKRRNVLRAICSEMDDVKEQERRYTEQTGFARADFFRRKHEISTGDFDEEDSL
jgi:hypothetical protein